MWGLDSAQNKKSLVSKMVLGRERRRERRVQSCLARASKESTVYELPSRDSGAQGANMRERVS